MQQQIEVRPASHSPILFMGPGGSSRISQGSSVNSSPISRSLRPMVEQEGTLSSRSSGQLDDLKTDVRQRAVILKRREKTPLESQSNCVIV